MTHRHHNDIRCSLHGRKVASITEYWDRGNKRKSHIWVVLVNDPELTATSDIREHARRKGRQLKNMTKSVNP